MVRLLRVLIRLLFRAAAVAALVWIARELMRRWVDGPEQPQVSGDWEAWRSETSPGVPAGADTAPSPVTPEPAPAKKARAKKAAAPAKAAVRVKPASPAEAPAAVEVGVDTAAEEPAPLPEPAPAKRRQRPLKATRLPKAGSGAEQAPAGSGAETAAADKAPAEKRTRRKSAAATWVSPNGSGQAPTSHPVKAKLLSRLYRVPGMPTYERTVPDRCYATPEAAEADGFTRAAR